MSFSFDMNSPFADFSPPAPPDGCTQCGICVTTCPTFVKSEDPEQSPMGRVRLMRLLEKDDSEGLPAEKIAKLESCLGCYNCELICPSKVNFGKMMDESLARLREQEPLPRITRMMLWLASRTSVIKSIMQVTYFAQRLGLRALASKLGLLRLMGLQRANALLGKAAYPGELINCIHQADSKQRVSLFTGCFTSVMEQDIHQAAIDVFNALGIEVLVPKGQGCCGALHRHNGELKASEQLAKKNIQAFSADKIGAIVTTSSGCGASLKEYGKWLEDEELSMPVMDVSHYLVNALQQNKLLLNPLSLKVALHTPCTLRQGEGQDVAVVDLLQQIPGLEVVPLSGEPRCCGAGGSHVLSQPEMADALRDDIVEEIGSTGVDVLVSSNMGCAMHLREGLVQAGIDIPLMHPVQLITQSVFVEN